MQIEIVPVWRFRKHEDDPPMLVMLDFLNEIRATGKITRAAEQAHISYRHAWNLIEKWSDFFDVPLVERQQGRGTTLTPFGERLVWAGQRLQARLMPQLANLAQELETEISQFLPREPATIRMNASHGFAIEKLRELLNHLGQVGIDLRYVSNETSLVSLSRGECDLAGMHLPQGELRQEAIEASRKWLSPDRHRVISFATREMGLMVKRGNPLGLTSVEQLCDSRIRFVNRDPASGTAHLFSAILAQHDIDPAAVSGYTQIEFTHAAVAAYVASGMADACFGVEAAARQFDLDFIRLVTEDYFFVCRKELLETAAMEHILSVMRSPEFHAAVAALPGYAPVDLGVTKPLADVFRSDG